MRVALGFDRSTITKAETGSWPPTDGMFAAWRDTCKVSAEAREILSGLLILARRKLPVDATNRTTRTMPRTPCAPRAVQPQRVLD